MYKTEMCSKKYNSIEAILEQKHTTKIKHQMLGRLGARPNGSCHLLLQIKVISHLIQQYP